MKTRFYMVAVLFSIGLFSAGANAVYVQVVPGQPNDGDIDLSPVTAPGWSATYSPTTNVESIWFSSGILPQDPASVAVSIVSQFGGSLVFEGFDNDFVSAESVSVANGFNILAVHLGGGSGDGNELLFFFDSLVTEFDVDTFGIDLDDGPPAVSNLSNYRAYRDESIYPDPIPLPAAAWLFGSALLGLAGVARRKKVA